jgi:hypothetical protein
MRNKIWSALVNAKYKGYVIGLLTDLFQKRDRAMNIFLALTSSGSIAAWAIWDKYGMIWALIIAISQVVTVLKPYFPYYKYVKELNGKRLKIDDLNIDFEKLWDKIQTEKIREDEASEIYFELKKKFNEIMHFGDDAVFTASKEIQRKASDATRLFLKNDYNIEIEIDYKQLNN